MSRAGWMGRAVWGGILTLAAACRPASPPPPLTAQVSGTLNVVGISAPVRIVRDRWGVPHVYAETRDDVFFAQGFVQAQDRLFQMELWRREAEGKLAEVLGANFIERDAMTRRLQYRGDMSSEWSSYGPDVTQMANAFVRGVNAWVALARARAPELFVVAGWPVVFWTADDLLTRTDAFDREGTIAAAEAQGLPGPVVDAVRRAAVPAFFTGLAQPPHPPASSTRTSAGKPLRDATTSSMAAKAGPLPDSGSTVPGGWADAEVVQVPAPPARYLIHLHTPNWNAIGAAVPWRPGIVIGHDDLTTFERHQQRMRAVVRVSSLDASAGRVERDVIAVKGRAEPFVSSTQVTSLGVVVATDREGGRQFTLAWDGHRQGTAPAFASGRVGQITQVDRTGEVDRPGAAVIFRHPLAITDAARARFTIGPLKRPPGGAAPFFVEPDQNAWDASRAMSAPGQSEDPASEHFADLAALWAAGQSITLAFSDGAVTATAATTLILVPDRRR